MLLAVFAIAGDVAAQVEPLSLPALSGRVVDSTSTLSPGDRAALAAKLERLEADTGSQLVVAIIPTTGPEAIEQYSIRLAEAWQIGRVASMTA